MRGARLAALLLWLVAGACVRADAGPALEPALIARIESAITKTMREQHIAGLAIGIVRDGRPVYRRGFGIADMRSGRAVTPRTVFQMGSDSKMFVGIAIMQLVARGLLDLDAPLTTYLPYFRIADPRYPRITLRHLLSHASGLPWCSSYADCVALDYRLPESDAGALERHTRHLDRVRLNHAPGSAMDYSDLGFELLGDVIAKVSGQPFEDYVREHVFAPLGMRESTFLLREVPVRRLAWPHVLKPTLQPAAVFPYSRQHAPSSHLFSTVDDMNRFAVGLIARRQATPPLLPAAAWDTLWSPQIATAMPSTWEKTLGLGWFLGGEPGHRLVGHAGGDTGFDSEFILAPDDGAAVALMINGEFVVEGLCHQVLQWVLAANAERGAAPAVARAQ